MCVSSCYGTPVEVQGQLSREYFLAFHCIETVSLMVLDAQHTPV